MLRAIYADGARGRVRSNLILGEDFCGTAALSRAWCELLPRGRAIGVDRDAATLARAREMATGRMELVRADVRRIRRPVDVVAVLNFSICELHTRRALVGYLRHARSRLRRGGRFVCDVYGGSDAFETGLLDQRIRPPARPHPGWRDRITYSWEQRTADPLTGRVVNAMHFEVVRVNQRPLVLLNAFVYDWRLWSVPELRETMAEAGFGRTEVYPRAAGAVDGEGNLYARAIEDPTELEESFNVFVVGR